MQVGDLVKMKEPSTQYSWRQGAGEGLGVIITAPHRTATSFQGCTVFWPAEQKTKDIPKDWLEVIV